MFHFKEDHKEKKNNTLEDSSLLTRILFPLFSGSGVGHRLKSVKRNFNLFERALD